MLGHRLIGRSSDFDSDSAGSIPAAPIFFFLEFPLSGRCPKRLNGEWESWICGELKAEGSLYCQKHSFSRITLIELNQALLSHGRVHVQHFGRILKNFKVISIDSSFGTARLRRIDANGQEEPEKEYSIDVIRKVRGHERRWLDWTSRQGVSSASSSAPE